MKNTLTKMLFCSFIAGILLVSCQFDDDGGVSISPFGWFLIIGFFVIVIVTGISANKTQKETNEKMKNRGMDYSQFTEMGTYVGGHPNIDKNVEYASLRKVDNNLVLYKVMGVSMPEKIINSEISIGDITNITVEDASSIESKITIGRIFLVGVFALGWKKKKKNELAFVVIEWKKGRFDHSTTFSFEGKDAMQKANTARNRLIGMCE